VSFEAIVFLCSIESSLTFQTPFSVIRFTLLENFGFLSFQRGIETALKYYFFIYPVKISGCYHPAIKAYSEHSRNCLN
jgi:hypothetical protein